MSVNASEASIEERLEAWRKLSRNLGLVGFISPDDDFKNCASAPWLNATSSGIYSFIKDNLVVYVGQSIHARRRLKEHFRGEHRDMRAASFKFVPPDRLNEAESFIIRAFNNEFNTRNIKYAIKTAAHVAFDSVVADSSSDLYISKSHDKRFQDWRDLNLIAQKHGEQFEWLRRSERYNAVLRAVKVYVSNCIPMPDRTENRFWSVSVLPHYAHFIRINAGQQEVFTIHFIDSVLHARVLARNDMLDGYGSGPEYQTKSYEYDVPIEQFSKWLTATRARACRELVVWLMRHTTPLNNGSHCPQVVRASFAS